jgi:PAS domain S-box-containing protein
MSSHVLLLQITHQMPHGYCYLWHPGLIALHGISDALIGLAYISIPLVLARFLRQRRDLPFNWLVWCFAIFILACGATHLMGLVNIWIPSWWTTGAVKAVTAIASIPTAVLLWRLVPTLVSLPSPTQLRESNERLAAEIRERLRVEQQLRDAQLDLERRVDERTAELATASASLRLLESAVTQASDAFTVTTADLDAPGPTIVFANPAMTRITGFANDELLGRSPRLLQGPQTDRAAFGEMRATLSAGRVFSAETVNYRRDGTDFLMAWRVTPVRDAAGTTTHFVAVHRDVTEQRSMERQLQQAQKMEAVGQLAGGIAHDFNNLLTAIQGNCALLKEDLPADDERRLFVDEIEDAGARAVRLTRQLLAFSRRQIRQPAAVNLNSVVLDALRLLGRLLGERVDIRFTPTDDLGLVWADPDQLEQVVLNLAVNARDAMPRGGTLTIETSNVELDADYAKMHMPVIPGPYVLLCVTDTGTGMSPLLQTRIFEPFFTTKPAGLGTGLGLSTVYGIVKQSRGNVWVYSEEGRGTTFKIYLPRVPDSSQVAFVQPVEPAGVIVGSGVVLLAEDDSAVRGIARRMLERAGYDVIEASTAERALELVRNPELSIDIVLTDLILPDLTGVELAAEIRRTRAGIRVAFMSGYTDSTLDAIDLKAVNAVFIAKPFTSFTLTAQIAQA